MDFGKENTRNMEFDASSMLSSGQDSVLSKSSRGNDNSHGYRQQPPRRRNSNNSETFQMSGSGSNNNGKKPKSGSKNYGGNGRYQNRYDQQQFNDRNSRYRQQRITRPSSPRPNRSNPFSLEISDFDLRISGEKAIAIQELYSQVQIDPEIVMKLQSLTVIAQSHLYQQHVSYSEFLEQKREHEIGQWLASSTEEERKQYLERTKHMQSITGTAPVISDNVINNSPAHRMSPHTEGTTDRDEDEDVEGEVVSKS